MQSKIKGLIMKYRVLFKRADASSTGTNIDGTEFSINNIEQATVIGIELAKEKKARLVMVVEVTAFQGKETEVKKYVH